MGRRRSGPVRKHHRPVKEAIATALGDQSGGLLEPERRELLF